MGKLVVTREEKLFLLKCEFLRMLTPKERKQKELILSKMTKLQTNR